MRKRTGLLDRNYWHSRTGHKQTPWWAVRSRRGEAPLRRTAAECIKHFHYERNHQGKENRLLFPASASLRPRPKISSDSSRAPGRTAEVLSTRCL